MVKFGCIFFVCVLALLNFNTAAAYAQDEFKWDFGVVKEGRLLQHDFIIKNELTRELKIRDVNTSCGCTVSKVGNKTLKPQESTVVEVKFNSKGYSGKVRQYVYVSTDNLDNPVLKYIIEAEVVK